jgi:hypothetical protein
MYSRPVTSIRKETFMTRSHKTLSALAILAACALPLSHASAQQDSAAAKIRTYDATSAVTLTGVKIIRVDTLSGTNNPSLSLVVESGADSLNAMIGPVTFLASNSLTLAAGDVVDISGSKVTMAGKPSLIATEIKKGETKVVLRDKATGAPAWPSGTAMRKP